MGTPHSFNVCAAAKNLKRKFASERVADLKRYHEAVADCAAIIRMIRNDYHPYRIYQWGSLLNSEKFNEHSDIDIAIEGLCDTKAWFELTGKALAMTRFSLDIVELEHVDSIDRQSIIAKGVLVYERPESP